MKRLVSVLGLFVILASCQDFAAMKNLTPQPAADLTIELLDQSEVVSDNYYAAVFYTSFSTTHPDWLDYLSVTAALFEPWDDEGTYEDVSGFEIENGNLRLTHRMYPLFPSQGEYTLRLFAIDEGELAETYDYNMDVDVDGSSLPVFPRNTDYYMQGSPYILEQVSSYSVAVDDAGDALYFQPADSFSAGLDLIYYIVFGNTLEYMAFLGADDLQVGKWTRLAVNDLVPMQQLNRSIDPTEFRADDGTWIVESYATVLSREDWGNFFRSEVRPASISAEVPQAADTISPSASSRSLPVIPPMAVELLDEYLGK